MDTTHAIHTVDTECSNCGLHATCVIERDVPLCNDCCDPDVCIDCAYEGTTCSECQLVEHWHA